MAFDFKLPDIGEGTQEGEIVRWLAKEGDVLKEDQPLVEVMTDKATVEITSPRAGVLLRRNAKEGETVQVGAVLLVIGDAGESAGDGATSAAAPSAKTPTAPSPAPKPSGSPTSAATPTKPPSARPAAAPAGPSDEGDLLFEDKNLPKIDLAAMGTKTPAAGAPAARPPGGLSRSTPAPASPRPVAPSPSPATRLAGAAASAGGAAPAGAPVVVAGRVLAAPATRKLAREIGVDLLALRGSGPGGRVTQADVRAAHEHSFSPGGAPAGRRPVTPSGPREERVPLRGLRKRISEKMATSKRTAAHFTYVDEVDVTELVELRERMKPLADARGVKLTYLPFVFKALAHTLPKYPYLNASLDEAAAEIVLKRYYNFAFATHTDAGLTVPVVKDVDRKGLLQLAGEIQVLAEKARTGKLALDEVQDSTFTITSAGSIGGLFATPVINHPEVAIVGVHKIVKRPVVKNDQILVRDVMYLSISLDHRVVDGAVGAYFMNDVIRLLETPSLLLVEMLEGTAG